VPTIDFLLSAFRDADAAKRLFRKALGDRSHPQPRVINTDLAPIYTCVIPDSKEEGTLRNRCRHRSVQYLNNILEQDHRAIKRRVNAKQGFREFQAARRTIQGYEAIDMIRKGQVRWVAGDDPSTDSVHRRPFRLGSLRTHERRSATNLSAFETCNTTNLPPFAPKLVHIQSVEGFCGGQGLLYSENEGEHHLAVYPGTARRLACDLRRKGATVVTENSVRSVTQEDCSPVGMQFFSQTTLLLSFTIYDLHDRATRETCTSLALRSQERMVTR
jgi:hypothetical protein